MNANCSVVYVSATNAIIGSGNGLSAAQHQAIIWTDALLLLTGL